MITLKGIDGQIEVLEGRTDIDPASIPSFRSLLRMILCNQVPRNAEESLDTHQILLKLRIDTPDISFENAEFKLILAKVEENQMKLVQSPYGQLLYFLKNNGKESKELKVAE